jgi:uncharacterized protein YkwD
VKIKITGLIVLCCALAAFNLNTVRQVSSQTTQFALSPTETDLLNEINQARANPQLYADYLEKLKPLFKGKNYTPAGSSNTFQTQEGWTAVEDAIKFMRAAKPQPALSRSTGLCMAAKAHVTDQSASGSTGHRGGDRMMIEDRVKPYGSWQGGIGENLAYGEQSSRERVLTWLIDDGFATRGHRNRLLSDTYKTAGICCGPHKEYGAMCVLTLAGDFTETSSQGNQKSSAPAKVSSTSQPATSTQTPSNTNAKPANSNSNSNKSNAAKPKKP